MDALVFDFDGVVVDSEPIHLAAFSQVLRKIGIALTKAQYFGRYLGYDDHDCFLAVMKDNGRPCTEDQIAQMIAEKTAIVQKVLAESVGPLPGAVALISAAADKEMPLAICSGALRAEIVLAAGQIGVLKHFAQIVSARDVAKGKPDPEGYLLALRGLSEATGRTLEPRRCFAIEDSPAGIASAKAAGMKVLAVTNSYPADELAQADHVATSLEDVTVESLDALL